MSRLMKSALATLCLASGLFALDEYLPIPFRVMQIDAGFERTSISGYYQHSWENDENADPDNPFGIPVQGKFGIVENMEGSMAINYMIMDSLGKTGLDRPTLGLKYAHPVSGVGGFLGISLPLGFEDIMNSGDYATMTFGALYGKKFPHVNVLANASYSFNTEDNQKSKIDNMRLFAKPEYPVPYFTRHKQYLGISLSAVYNFYFNNMFEGKAVDENAHLFQVVPGIYYTFTKLVAVEINTPISLSGQNQPGGQAFRMRLFFTLEEGLYNSL